MSSNSQNKGCPSVIYEADDLNDIIKPDSSVYDHGRYLISKTLGTNDERAFPFSALDNISRVIRSFETEDRIFFSNNESGRLSYFKDFPQKLAKKAYCFIRKAMSELFQGQLGSKELLWLMVNLNSIQVITRENNITKIIFLMNDFSKKEFFASDENTKLVDISRLN